ncbi:hypothetical protein MMC12_004251 [Toensbergia leucococca]|nr:hypothetical protein [Toensbergia leucococca]
MTTSSAFTAVSARRTFARPTPPFEPVSNTEPVVAPGASPTGAEKSKRDWPLSVRQYVQRAFAIENAVPGISRQEMESKLKLIISDAADNNTLNALDWETMPLPQQMIQRERAIVVQTSAETPRANDLSSLSLHETNGSSNGTLSKKRKSSDLVLVQADQDSQPPWRNTNSRNVFEERISYPDKRPRYDTPGKGTSKSHNALDKRRHRFEDEQSGFLTGQPLVVNITTSDTDQGPVVGRCQDLEKRYFRLTSAPNPDTVRPLPVLEKTLEHLKRKWKKENNYSYICDQFKSLRQDLTVQHIKIEFTVNVYEIHARIALEKGDLGEYNQCQTQLRALYPYNLGGHPTEFKAYRILYFIHTCNRTDMNDVLADLTTAEKREPAIKHALDARSALALGNYHRFFQLYLETPNMGAYLMDMFVARERLAALSNMCKSYKPAVKLRFITEELGFESDEESARFLCDYGAQTFLEEREDGVCLLTGKVGNTLEVAKDAAFKRVDIKGQM